jgi:hypothetical protein
MNGPVLGRPFHNIAHFWASSPAPYRAVFRVELTDKHNKDCSGFSIIGLANGVGEWEEVSWSTILANFDTERIKDDLHQLCLTSPMKCRIRHQL